jgi:glycosyltransferase involved in cell wall biosynthesis
VPPKHIGSVAKVVHETSRLLADQFTFTIIGSPRNRDATQEAEGIVYRSVDDRWDRLLTHRWASVMERLRGWNRHPLHREIYRPLYVRRAVSIFRDAGCEVVVVHQCPQWLPILRRGLPGVKLLFWGHAATYVEEAGKLRDQLALADGVIGCSQYIARRMEEQVPSLRGRAFTVYNGFDHERFFPDVSVERKKARLLYTGRVTPEKGVNVLVDGLCQDSRHLGFSGRSM